MPQPTDHIAPRPTYQMAPRPQPGEAELPVHDARALTGHAQRARIQLDGQDYQLRITRAGKLILTK